MVLKIFIIFLKPTIFVTISAYIFDRREYIQFYKSRLRRTGECGIF